MKKLLVIGIVVILLIGLAAAPYIIDNIACARFENEMQKKLTASEDIYLVEILGDCGNTGGTGNHTDLWVAARIATDLSKEEVKKLFPEAYTVQEEEETVTMRIMGKTFETIFCEPQPCYTVEFSKKAPCSAFDMRGH